MDFEVLCHGNALQFYSYFPSQKRSFSLHPVGRNFSSSLQRKILGAAVWVGTHIAR
jgi:hypothetical protein